MKTFTPDPRYAPGGGIYTSLADRYGTPAAERVYRASLSGEDGAIAAAIAEAKHGAPLEESSVKIFGQQIADDPLAAPLAAANRQIGKLAFNFLKNPLAAIVIVGVIGLVVYAYVPGARSFFARLTAK